MPMKPNSVIMVQLCVFQISVGFVSLEHAEYTKKNEPDWLVLFSILVKSNMFFTEITAY